MTGIHLHIIAFDIPFPTNYGGVIDVFYMIKALSEAGVMIHLHAFEYGKGKSAEELEKLCFSVNYYPRLTGIMASITRIPYITASRKSELLMTELTKDKYPILFEGLHTCFHINDKKLSGRLKLFRATNIEHQYYYNLAIAERNLVKKIYFIMAALKLRYYQSVIQNADIVLAVSNADSNYFENKFPNSKVITLPCFHANTLVSHERVGGNYVLFHGNLEVAENERAAIYLIRKVMNNIDYPFIIAGNNPSVKLSKIAVQYPNVILKATPDESTMSELIRKAHINLLISFQATGLKLKLLNALFNGCNIVVNNNMLHGTGLEKLCYIANTPNEMINQLSILIKSENYSTERNKNFSVLYEKYDNKKNALKLIDQIK